MLQQIVLQSLIISFNLTKLKSLEYLFCQSSLTFEISCNALQFDHHLKPGVTLI